MDLLWTKWNHNTLFMSALQFIDMLKDGFLMP